ncbi:unnamed protein product, partial [Ectocarpus sp. 12 AP-2014]
RLGWTAAHPPATVESDGAAVDARRRDAAPVRATGYVSPRVAWGQGIPVDGCRWVDPTHFSPLGHVVRIYAHIHSHKQERLYKPRQMSFLLGGAIIRSPQDLFLESRHNLTERLPVRDI